MDNEKFFDIYNLNKTQRNIAKSMILSGSTQKEALVKVQGYSGGSLNLSDNKSLKCPKCLSTMKVVNLVNDRKAKHCTNDNVTLPLSL